MTPAVLLRALASGSRTAAQVAVSTGRPVAKVRSGLQAMGRESPRLVHGWAGDGRGWRYQLTDAGREALRRADGEIGMP